MSEILFKGNPIQTCGKLPKVGETIPEAILVAKDLSEKTLSSFKQRRKVLNIFPSLDTGVCAESVRNFYQKIPNSEDVIVLNISKDLPFSQSRFCTQENLKQVVALSAFRSSFADDFGLEILEGPLKGLCSRAVLVIDENNKVIYSEQVQEISQEPNYEAVLQVFS